MLCTKWMKSKLGQVLLSWESHFFLYSWNVVSCHSNERRAKSVSELGRHATDSLNLSKRNELGSTTKLWIAGFASASLVFRWLPMNCIMSKSISPFPLPTPNTLNGLFTSRGEIFSSASVVPSCTHFTMDCLAVELSRNDLKAFS